MTTLPLWRRRYWHPALQLLLIALCAGALISCENPERYHATDLGHGSLGGEFSANLLDFDGRPSKLADFRGKAVILFFGYASCPDICPTALSKFAQVLQQPDIDRKKVQVLFITLDPERDTPSLLRPFITWFDPDFIALTGSPAAIAQVAQQYRVTHQRKSAPDTALGYVIDHSAGAYVIDPQGQLRLYVADNATIEQIAADLKKLFAAR